MMRHKTPLLLCLSLAFLLMESHTLAIGIEQKEDLVSKMESLPVLNEESSQKVEEDWLIRPAPRTAGVYRRKHPHEVLLCNGLIRRTFRLLPNAATVAYDNLMTGASILRGVKPEAVIELDGIQYEVGGLKGQEEYGYLQPEKIDSFTSDPESFQLCNFKRGKTKAPFSWNRKRYARDLPWPPPGVRLTFFFEPPDESLKGLSLDVHYEMYDGIPLLCKWFTLVNRTPRTIRLNSFTSEILAAVEYETCVGEPPWWELPNLHIESDYAFHGMTSKSANVTTHWVPDPQYTSQVNYRLKSPVMMESRPPLGPDLTIESGETFVSFRTFELVFDSTERERKGLAKRRMYRTIAPWTTENPILMHVRYADPDAVRLAVDQCAEVGFEMIIMTFGSGFNAEAEDAEYRAKIKALADYAHGKGIELGGYSLLASRRISDEHDVIHPETGKTGGATFGNSPCLCSEWGNEYFRKLKTFFEDTGLDVLEHDGSYPGDVCASEKHPGHSGLGDSQWKQWKKITDFYRWCREKGVYLNVPDWYFLNGSNKNGMGYREVNWSLPRARQIILGRQNIFDGTWEKNASMGWMFVPLVEYHGGGAAATLEPLQEHLDAYGAHLAQNFGAGVQACYRGPRLFDSEETKEVVKKWVDFYKKYRAILDSDIIHLRRPDCRDLDGLLHVNPNLKHKGLAVFFNPLDRTVNKEIILPLYYTGLTETVMIREQEGVKRPYTLDRRFNVRLEVEVKPNANTWFVIE
jgi:hypothetical protein